MDTIKKGVLTLIKIAVTGEKQDLPGNFAIEEALPQIKRHHMVTLAYEGAVRCGIDKKETAMQQLFQGYLKSMLISEGQLQELQRIFTAFDENGIDYMPLKGTLMKERYPKPELRIMGDADILIRLAQYEKISGIMTALGFTETANSDHELVWRSPKLYLELHKRLIPSYNKDFYAFFGEGWQLAKRQNGKRFSMTAEDEMVYLFTHFAKHFRDGGIGLRHMTDLFVYQRANPSLDEAYVVAELEKLQLLSFYNNIKKLLRVFFMDEAEDELSEILTEYIFESGSWGKLESRILATSVRDLGESRSPLKKKLLYLKEIAFPSLNGLKFKYPILKRAPWALPLVWIYRPFYKLLFEKESLNRHEQAISAMKKEDIDRRREFLSAIGLDYNF
ncbi:MAG: nucleotidyltransferase family protein [Christensenellaceae bacterium]|nr:nucleotidyltransferase family protein [Christensenellaceae bacterium]